MSGYTRSPKLLKGALIQFSAPMLIPIPNIIIFQYNPETLSRSLKPWAPKEEDDKPASASANNLAQPYDPEESFTLALELDAADALEHPESHPVAVLVGVADRIAAIEMLLYPPADAASGLLSASVSVSAGGISASAGATSEVVPRTEVPIVLFFWGPGRIVPVRITSFTVDEQAFNPILYPIRAKASLGLQVAPPNYPKGQSTTAVQDIAKFCYDFTQKQKQALALANLANSVESIIGMLPF
jgi:hypothetical protein